MTLPSEEKHSLKITREFLRSLVKMNMTEIRKDAKSIRQQAIRCLRHYPWQIYLDEMYEQRIKEKEPWSIKK